MGDPQILQLLAREQRAGLSEIAVAEDWNRTQNRLLDGFAARLLKAGSQLLFRALLLFLGGQHQVISRSFPKLLECLMAGRKIHRGEHLLGDLKIGRGV